MPDNVSLLQYFVFIHFHLINALYIVFVKLVGNTYLKTCNHLNFLV